MLNSSIHRFAIIRTLNSEISIEIMQNYPKFASKNLTNY